MNKIEIIYDGDCPFCRNYTEFVKLRTKFDSVILTNARDCKNSSVIEMKTKKIDLDDGMVVIIDGQFWHGDEAMRVITNYIEPAGFWGLMNSFMFSNSIRSRFFYPILRFGRNLVLRLLGKSKINT